VWWRVEEVGRGTWVEGGGVTRLRIARRVRGGRVERVKESQMMGEKRWAMQCGGLSLECDQAPYSVSACGYKRHRRCTFPA
jgi:hypothetical protein